MQVITWFYGVGPCRSVRPWSHQRLTRSGQAGPYFLPLYRRVLRRAVQKQNANDYRQWKNIIIRSREFSQLLAIFLRWVETTNYVRFFADVDNTVQFHTWKAWIVWIALIVLPGLPVSWGSLRWSRWQVSGCQECTSIYGQMATDSVNIAHDYHFGAFPASPEVDSCTWHSLGATVDVDLWRVPAASIFEGSLEVKLPTIWTVEKQRWEE